MLEPLVIADNNYRNQFKHFLKNNIKMFPLKKIVLKYIHKKKLFKFT